MKRLFRDRFKGLCEMGAEMLQAFAIARPTDFQFLDASDIQDRASSAFAGIPEWDSFAEHITKCKHCHVR